MKVIRAIQKGIYREVLVDEDDFERVSKTSWHIDHMGYARGVIKGKNIFMARLIMGATDPLVYVDHINGNPLDNRKCNLRLANNSQNQANRQKHPLNKSGRRGVCWNKNCKKWQAGIKHHGKSYHLGLFDDIEDAAKAYRDAAEKIYGEFAEHRKAA